MAKKKPEEITQGCPNCGGSGKIIMFCALCGGNGRKHVMKTTTEPGPPKMVTKYETVFRPGPTGRGGGFVRVPKTTMEPSRFIPKTMMEWVTCTACGGRGKTVVPCPICKGSGRSTYQL